VILVGRVADQDVELPELSDCALDGVDADVGVGEVAFDDDAAASFRFDRRRVIAASSRSAGSAVIATSAPSRA